MGCRHKQRVYKIELLYEDDQFEEKQVFLSTCQHCGWVKLVLVFFYRGRDSYWKRIYQGEKALKKYNELKMSYQIKCDYTHNLHPELDIGLTFLEGKDGTIRKFNGAVVEKFKSELTEYDLNTRRTP